MTVQEPSNQPTKLFDHYAVDAETYYMKMGNFSDEEAIHQLYD
ncbi:hypothetical protein [Streptococcus sp. 20-1249]